MAAVAVRKKVVSIGHFSPSFCFQSVQIILLVRSKLRALACIGCNVNPRNIGLSQNELDETKNDYKITQHTTSYAH